MSRVVERPSPDRVQERVAAWGIDVERTLETETSVLVFGKRKNQPVVLKVVQDSGDEWRSGEMLRAFEGRGAVRVYESVPGAILLERLSPGGSLATKALSGDDEEATRILANVIRELSPNKIPESIPTVQKWGEAFDHYLESGDTRIPNPLVCDAQRIYSELCRSQTRVRLLHGDLHHYNVLFDAKRGWVAIDPKGVLGEREYEVGAALRNPYEKPELFTDASRIQSRMERFVHELGLDPKRVVSWAFAQAVLSTIWAIEDGLPAETSNGWLALADALQAMLPS